MADNLHQFGGSWVQLKFETVGRYLKTCSIALKNAHFKKIHIDASDGNGQYDITKLGSRDTF